MEIATVVLLHGLGRSARSMRITQRRLREAGFAAVSIGYPSRRSTLAEAVAHVRERLPEGASPLHFVTHSLGGIVVRALVREERPPHLGRVVMLGPPNGGSSLARRLQGVPLVSAILGPVCAELAAGEGCVPLALGPVDFELGVIAGTGGLDPLAPLWRRPSDGRVTVEETRVEGMADFLEVPGSHAFLMNRADVLAQIVHFLREGRFARESLSAADPGRSTDSRRP